MKSSIETHLETLKLAYPFTKQELDHAYRTCAFECHPDITGGDTREFIKVKDAYDILTPMCVLSSEKEVITFTTIEGDLIFNLGKGFEDLVNSKDCSECQGKGWYKSVHTTYESGKICPVCDGDGRVRTINNTPLWWRNWRPCRRCIGLGHLGSIEVKHETLHTCPNCKGVGQIEIFNPVLKKGWMQNQQQSTTTRKKKYCTCGAILVGSKCWRCEGTFRRKENANSCRV